MGARIGGKVGPRKVGFVNGGLFQRLAYSPADGLGDTLQQSPFSWL